MHELVRSALPGVLAAVVACGSFGSSGETMPAPAPAGAPEVIATGEKKPHALVLDATAVYWQNDGERGDGSSLVNGEIVRFDRSAGATRRAIVAAVTAGSGLVADDTALFWLQQEDDVSGGTIGRADKDGRGRTALDRTLYTYLAVGADASHLFYLDVFGSLVRTTKDGTGTIALRAKDDSARTLLVDANAAYVGTAGQIVRVDKDVADGSTLFAAISTEVTAMTSDATSVYWVSEPGGTVMKLETAGAGGNPTLIASGQKSPVGIAVGGGSVYWTNRGDGTVMRAPIMGGEAVAVATGQKEPAAVVADARAVFWTNAGDGTVARIQAN